MHGAPGGWPPRHPGEPRMPGFVETDTDRSHARSVTARRTDPRQGIGAPGELLLDLRTPPRSREMAEVNGRTRRCCDRGSSSYRLAPRAGDEIACYIDGYGSLGRARGPNRADGDPSLTARGLGDQAISRTHDGPASACGACRHVGSMIPDRRAPARHVRPGRAGHGAVHQWVRPMVLAQPLVIIGEATAGLRHASVAGPGRVGASADDEHMRLGGRYYRPAARRREEPAASALGSRGGQAVATSRPR